MRAWLGIGAIVVWGVSACLLSVPHAGDGAYTCEGPRDCARGFRCDEDQRVCVRGVVSDGGAPLADGGDEGGAVDDAGVTDDDAGATEDAGAIEDAGTPGDGGTDDAGATDGGSLCVDLDGDGRGPGCAAGDDDNCPVTPNPDQHDEDGDGVGDLCDSCPALAPASDDDGDGDGIGDLCDPQPDATDQRLVFDGLHQGLSGGWSDTRGAGDWLDGGDALVGLSTPVGIAFAERALAGSGRTQIVARLSFRAFGPDLYQSAMVTARRAGDEVFACGLTYHDDTEGDPPEDALELRRLDGAGGDPEFLNPIVTPAVAVDVTYSLTLTVDDGVLECRRTDQAASTSFDTGSAFAPTAIGLRSGNADIAFESIEVYRLGD